MSAKPLHPRLERTSPPAPPGRLRAAALAAAAGRWDARPDPWARLWESRTARWAWAAALAGLIAADFLLSAKSPRGAAGPAGETLVRREAPELAEATAVLRLRIDRVLWAGESPSPAPIAPRRAMPSQGPTKEPS